MDKWRVGVLRFGPIRHYSITPILHCDDSYPRPLARVLNFSRKSADIPTMSGQNDDLGSSLPIQVILDGQPLEIPGHARESLAAVRAYLESLALQRNRVVATFTVDGVAINVQKAAIEFKEFHR